MKTLNPAPKFLIYAVFRAIRHPKTPITYHYCPACRVRFSASMDKCPQCGDKVGSSPDPRQESPVPWYVGVIVILVGIGAWIASAWLEIPELGEAARALVYIPLGSLFGMSVHR